MLAGLPYVVWPIGSIFILASRKKEDPFLCYHAVQALLAGAVMAAAVVAVLLMLFIGFRVLPGSASYAPAVISLGTLVGGGGAVVCVFLTALFLGWRATEGEMLRLPFLGDFAEQKMLDQTGMTRRQFEEMCEAAFAVANREEEIPFPELEPQPEIASPPRAIDRLEAARQARAAQQQREAEEELVRQQEAQRILEQRQFEAQRQRELRRREAQRQAQTQRQGESQGAVPAQPPAARTSGPLHQRRPQMPAASQQASSQPVIKEVDLISHYKEKRVDTGPQGAQKNDLLKNWLSSVDQEPK